MSLVIVENRESKKKRKRHHVLCPFLTSQIHIHLYLKNRKSSKSMALLICKTALNLIPFSTVNGLFQVVKKLSIY